MQIYWDKRKSLHEKRVQLPQDWFGTPTWPPFHCFGTPIWPPWRHLKTFSCGYPRVVERSITPDKCVAGVKGVGGGGGGDGVRVRIHLSHRRLLLAKNDIKIVLFGFASWRVAQKPVESHADKAIKPSKKIPTLTPSKRSLERAVLTWTLYFSDLSMTATMGRVLSPIASFCIFAAHEAILSTIILFEVFRRFGIFFVLLCFNLINDVSFLECFSMLLVLPLRLENQFSKKNTLSWAWRPIYDVFNLFPCKCGGWCLVNRILRAAFPLIKLVMLAAKDAKTRCNIGHRT